MTDICMLIFKNLNFELIFFFYLLFSYELAFFESLFLLWQIWSSGMHGWLGFKFGQGKGHVLSHGETITKLRKFIDEIETSSSPESLGQFQGILHSTMCAYISFLKSYKHIVKATLVVFSCFFSFSLTMLCEISNRI